jgi:type II secretory pathway predicted ATPase ExeA
LEPLGEHDTGRFIAHRLEQAKAPDDLVEQDAMTLIAAHCRGNRREIMNVGTVLLDEAFYRKEKTITAELMAGCELSA